ncbi:MAG: NADH:ubiquinone oxidoreductase subunit 6 (subunit J) [Planctomycetota bacterium]
MDDKKLQLGFYTGLGGLSALALIGGLTQAAGPGLAFALFAIMTLGGALVCIWERSVVRSAFALMATFLGIAGLFLLLEADFLAAAQVLIYVGGILALILFGVMLTPPDLEERKLPRIVSGLVLMLGATAWVAFKVGSTVVWATTGTPGDGAIQSKAEGAIQSAEWIGIGFLSPNQYMVAFELAAVVLTVALVGAVYIARRSRVDLEPGPRAAGQDAGQAADQSANQTGGAS